MDFRELLCDKTIKPKAKTEILSTWIAEHPDSLNSLLDFAATAREPEKATCIEALEYATKKNPGIATQQILEFVSISLNDKSPRIKWESARVIGNIASLFPDKLEPAIGHLLSNTEHPGTVVRWSAAFALGQILKNKTPLNKELIPAIQAIIEREEKNSIRKIYLDALKKL